MNENWRNIGRKEANHWFNKMGGILVFPLIPKFATEFKTNGNNIKFRIASFEYEYNDIGMYHFRYINDNLWSRWTAV